MKKTIALAAVSMLLATSGGLSAQGMFIPDNPANQMYTISHANNTATASDYVNGVSTVYVGGKAADEIVGNRYLNEKFETGSIYFTDSTNLVDVMLRYNIFEQSMELVFDGDTLSIKPSYKIQAYNIGGKWFIHSLIFDEWTRGFSQSYFELVEPGEVALLNRYEKAFVHNSFSKYYMGGGGDGRYYYIDKESLYYKAGREAARKLKKRKSKVLDIFDDHREEMKRYMENGNLSVRKKDDLVKMFSYYNSL